MSVQDQRQKLVCGAVKVIIGGASHCIRDEYGEIIMVFGGTRNLDSEIRGPPAVYQLRIGGTQDLQVLIMAYIPLNKLQVACLWQVPQRDLNMPNHIVGYFMLKRLAIVCCIEFDIHLLKIFIDVVI